MILFPSQFRNKIFFSGGNLGMIEEVGDFLIEFILDCKVV